MGDIIEGRFSRNQYRFNRGTQRMSAVDVVKRPRRRHGLIRTEEPNCYEEAMEMKIELAKWRAEGYQDSNDWETAALEISYADGLEVALNEYRLWGL